MVLVKNWNFFHLSIWGKIGQESELHDMLEGQNAFLDYKNNKLKKSKNWEFSKGVSPWFWSKIGTFSIFLRQNRPRK